LAIGGPVCGSPNLNIHFYTDIKISEHLTPPKNGSLHPRVRATAVQGSKSCLRITRNGNTNYWKNAEVFAFLLVARGPMITARLKGDALKEIIKEGVDGVGLSSFYTVIKFRILYEGRIT
jgi:hypothetical protein